MSVAIEAAGVRDLPAMVDLLLGDARAREARDAALWPIAEDAVPAIEASLAAAIADERENLRRKWLVARAHGRIVGIAHAIRLPVPPIYAGRWGEPGLLMPEWLVTRNAPPSVLEDLLAAAETELRQSGATILLASLVASPDRRACLERRGYAPITLYLGKTIPRDGETPAGEARPAREADLEGIVRRSAEHRRLLFALDAFWEPHPGADARFGRWMRQVLAAPDRDMLVSATRGEVDGYVVVQPASRLHFPPGHDISRTVVVDDYFHRAFADPGARDDAGTGAAELLRAAEVAAARRGATAAVVVCPAAWTAKRRLLRSAGYGTAFGWWMKRPRPSER